MKITDDKSFDLEQFCATRASNQLRREQDYAQKARLARQSIADKKERDAKDQEDKKAFYWKAFYIFIHAVSILLVLTAVYKFWGG